MTKEDIERQHKAAMEILRDLEGLITRQKEEFQTHLDRINGLRFLVKQLDRLRAMDESTLPPEENLPQEEVSAE